MRVLFLIIIHGLRNPRYYIEAHFQKFKSILAVALIPMLFITFSNFFTTYPEVKNLQMQVNDSLSYIPKFSYENDKLILEDGEKPLYYQSDDYQLVIDPQVRSVPIFNTVPISKEKFRKIDGDKMITLLILRDETFVKISFYEQTITQPASKISSDTKLKSILTTITNKAWITILPLFIVSLLFAGIYYWLIILICSIVVGTMNQFLNQTLNLKQRMKIVVPMTFVPIILAEILQLIIPGFSLPIFPFAIFILIIYYQAFKSYTTFVNGLITNFTSEELQDFIDIPDNRRNLRKEEEIKLKQEALKKEYLKTFQELKRINQEENPKKFQQLTDKLSEIKYKIVENEIELKAVQDNIKEINEEIFREFFDKEKNNKKK